MAALDWGRALGLRSECSGRDLVRIPGRSDRSGIHWSNRSDIRLTSLSDNAISFMVRPPKCCERFGWNPRAQSISGGRNPLSQKRPWLANQKGKTNPTWTSLAWFFIVGAS